ncbi:hypothetical protein AWZ03_006954 [Drosophila navojoa]|uniref:Uncharacterized protein n=1 Tax=Drosophila navojoa TaxID=7232 RepID=A0A484BED2_DRONA|nr:hypothetical protein AWZ03_006954 [Drosophila navojoa]
MARRSETKVYHDGGQLKLKHETKTKTKTKNKTKTKSETKTETLFGLPWQSMSEQLSQAMGIAEAIGHWPSAISHWPLAIANAFVVSWARDFLKIAGTSFAAK